MFIEKLNNNFVRLYSIGKEKKYFGKSIEYYDNTNTFLIFYYSSLTRVYVINGKEKKDVLVQCKPKINKIITLDNKMAKRFINIINEIIKEDDFIFYIPPLFFRECYFFLDKKKYKDLILNLYKKYKKDIKDGINYPDF